MPASKENIDLKKWDSREMLFQYDVSKFIAKDDQKEIIYHIPNDLDIDYVSNKKAFLNQYLEVEIEYSSQEDYHRVICTKYN